MRKQPALRVRIGWTQGYGWTSFRKAGRRRGGNVWELIQDTGRKSMERKIHVLHILTL